MRFLVEKFVLERARKEPNRAALEERTRERVPLQWAMTQNNLGTALQALGERESGTARLEEAIAAYRAAVEERTRESVPLQWAMTQNNLGSVLLALGSRTQSRELIEEASQVTQSVRGFFRSQGINNYDAFFASQMARIEAELAKLSVTSGVCGLTVKKRTRAVKGDPQIGP